MAAQVNLFYLYNQRFGSTCQRVEGSNLFKATNFASLCAFRSRQPNQSKHPTQKLRLLCVWGIDIVPGGPKGQGDCRPGPMRM